MAANYIFYDFPKSEDGKSVFPVFVWFHFCDLQQPQGGWSKGVSVDDFKNRLQPSSVSVLKSLCRVYIALMSSPGGGCTRKWHRWGIMCVLGDMPRDLVSPFNLCTRPLTEIVDASGYLYFLPLFLLFLIILLFIPPFCFYFLFCSCYFPLSISLSVLFIPVILFPSFTFSFSKFS